MMFLLSIIIASGTKFLTDLMIVAVDRTSKFAFAELHERITKRDADNYLRSLIDAVLCGIHAVLTDNDTDFADPKGDAWAAAEVRQLIAEKARFRCHGFVLACAENDIDYRPNKPNHSWTNGRLLGDFKQSLASQRVESMSRTIKGEMIQRYHRESHERLRLQLKTFLDAYNFTRRLKTLKGLTVFEFVNKNIPRNLRGSGFNPTIPARDRTPRFLTKNCAMAVETSRNVIATAFSAGAKSRAC